MCISTADLALFYAVFRDKLDEIKKTKDDFVVRATTIGVTLQDLQDAHQRVLDIKSEILREINN